MSTNDDRIPVPTNGRRTPDPVAAPAGGSANAVPAAPAAAPDDDIDAPRVIVTPGQATAVGFGIIAGLILLVLGRRRGRKG